MKRAVLGRTSSAALALCALAAVVALISCGGDAGTSQSTGSSATKTPAPTPTATPGEFAGNYIGAVALDGGQTGTVSLTVQNDTHATGTLTISGGTTGDTVVPLTGLVDLIGGTFSLSGGSDIVSGTLPSPGISGFLSVQIGANTNPFHGTISRA